MSAIVLDVDKQTQVNCPHCKQDFDLTVKQKKPKVEVQEQEKETQSTKTIPETKIETKIEHVLPSYQPAYTCPDGNCGAVHKNKAYKQRPKGKCNNCSQFDRKEKGKCPWCSEGEIEPIDDEELDDLGIAKPTIEDHEHE